jgi:hypothetical protein
MNEQPDRADDDRAVINLMLAHVPAVTSLNRPASQT